MLLKHLRIPYLVSNRLRQRLIQSTHRPKTHVKRRLPSAIAILSLQNQWSSRIDSPFLLYSTTTPTYQIQETAASGAKKIHGNGKNAFLFSKPFSHPVRSNSSPRHCVEGLPSPSPPSLIQKHWIGLSHPPVRFHKHWIVIFFLQLEFWAAEINEIFRVPSDLYYLSSEVWGPCLSWLQQGFIYFSKRRLPFYSP